MSEILPQEESTPTDAIISKYENKINQNIITKTLSASKSGKSPEFTKEELAYLNTKKDEEDAEVRVIMPDPDITLKKGKTEINIKHAATLIKKMEEKYPTGNKINSEPTASFRLATPEESEMMSNYPPQQEIKTINKNAYEIRESILSHALSWVQYKKGFEQSPITPPTEDDVLEVAQKFYRFVENKK